MTSGLLAAAPSATLSIAYLVAAILFIHGLRLMTHPRTARRGNRTSAAGMAVAVGVTVLWFEILSPIVLVAALAVGAAIGVGLAIRVDTTQMPQLVGLFNGFGGGASALVAGAELVDRVSIHAVNPIPVEVGLAAGTAAIVGTVTFSGSLIAAGKLHGIGDDPIRYRGEQSVKVVLGALAILLGAALVATSPLAPWLPLYWAVLLVAGAVGVVFVLPIGGADMPVVISLLNACSGLAAATTGFVLDNSVLIIAGTLVGAAGMILTRVMCRSMNRTLTAVLLGGFGGATAATGEGTDSYEGSIMTTSPEEVEMLLDAARRVVIVPGYGMAVGQAQHAVAELANLLEESGVDVEFGIHPVAGRMPGHMNVLLAEANVPYDRMRELSEINPTFARTDVVIVIGANDVVNPIATTDDPSPIAGMPVLHVWDAQTVIVNKRSLSPGYAGIPNPLFANDNTYMLFGDARESMQALVQTYKETH